MPFPGRILIMDDEEQVRSVLADVLSYYSGEVTAVSNSRAAVEAFRSVRESGRPFDIAILDLTIQGGPGGVETMKELQKIDPGVRAVISSGYADDPIVMNYTDCGFMTAIAKPYTASALQGLLEDTTPR